MKKWFAFSIFTFLVAIVLVSGVFGQEQAGAQEGQALKNASSAAVSQGNAFLESEIQIPSGLKLVAKFVFGIDAQTHVSFEEGIVLVAFWLFVLLYAVTRFVIEMVRDDPRGFIWGGLLSTSQGLGIPLAILSVFMLFYLKRHRRS